MGVDEVIEVVDLVIEFFGEGLVFGGFFNGAEGIAVETVDSGLAFVGDFPGGFGDCREDCLAELPGGFGGTEVGYFDLDYFDAAHDECGVNGLVNRVD